MQKKSNFSQLIEISKIKKNPDNPRIIKAVEKLGKCEFGDIPENEKLDPEIEVKKLK